jgi:hypothetical protein
MDTKFSSDYWSHPQVEAAAAEIKLAGAWMRTNDRVTLFGYVAVTPRKFAFETGLAETDLGRAIEALGEWFVRAPGGYFIPGYIGEQIGRGDSLVYNNVCKGLVRALVALHQPDISALVLQYYPELAPALKVASFAKPLATPPGGVREEKRREEQSSEEKNRDRGLGEGTANAPRRPPPKKPRSGVLPESQPEPMRGRMLSLNAMFRREPTDLWSEAEQLALASSGLLDMHELDFADACETVRAFYHAQIPREMEVRFRRRTSIEQLLANWGGELDKARAWARERSNDGVVKV